MIINGVLAFGWIIALPFSIGDVDTALESPTGYPIIETFYRATGSVGTAMAMMCAIIIVAFFAVFGILASTSQRTWLLLVIKDCPFPISLRTKENSKSSAQRLTMQLKGKPILRDPDPDHRSRERNIASTTAFNAILSLATLSLYIFYLIPIIIFALRKINNQRIASGPFRLGPFGLYISIFAIVYRVWSAHLHLSLVSSRASSDENQHELLEPGFWGCTFLRGRKRYTGPIREGPARIFSFTL